jgi:hypothetical protein
MDTSEFVIKDQFVSSKIARELKTLGFDEPCIARFNNEQFQMNKLGNWYKHNSGEIEKHYISAPLWQQVINWFIKEYDIHLSIDFISKKDLENKILETIKLINEKKNKKCNSMLV